MYIILSYEDKGVFNILKCNEYNAYHTMTCHLFVPLPIHPNNVRITSIINTANVCFLIQ